MKTYIVLPGVVWGFPTGALADSGAQNIHSKMQPLLVIASLKRGQAGFVGPGLNVWPHVDVNESA